MKTCKIPAYKLNGCSNRNLTTHSTGADLARMSSLTWMPFDDTSRPVNSGVRVLSLECGARYEMRNEQYAAFIRGKIIAICEAILNEEIGVIAGSRRLNSLEGELLHNEVGWFQRDEGFVTFVAVDSETDHLPVDAERHN